MESLRSTNVGAKSSAYYHLKWEKFVEKGGENRRKDIFSRFYIIKPILVLLFCIPI